MRPSVNLWHPLISANTVTVTKFIQSEKHEDLREALISAYIELCPLENGLCNRFLEFLPNLSLMLTLIKMTLTLYTKSIPVLR